MILIDEASQVATVAERWAGQYRHKGEWTGYARFNPEKVYDRLVALSTSATAAEVAAIIGNGSWIGETCSECKANEAIIRVGEEPDYESATAYLCANCFRKAVTLVEGLL